MNKDYVENPLLINGVVMGDSLAQALLACRCFIPYIFGGELPSMENYHPLAKFPSCIDCALGAKAQVLWSLLKKMDRPVLVLEDTGSDDHNPARIQSQAEALGIETLVISKWGSIEATIEALAPLVNDDKRIARTILRLKTEEIMIEERLSKLKATLHDRAPVKVLATLGLRNPQSFMGYHFICRKSNSALTTLKRELPIDFVDLPADPSLSSDLLSINESTIKEAIAGQAALWACMGESTGTFAKVHALVKGFDHLPSMYPLPYYDYPLRFQKGAILSSWLEVLETIG